MYNITMPPPADVAVRGSSIVSLETGERLFKRRGFVGVVNAMVSVDTALRYLRHAGCEHSPPTPAAVTDACVAYAAAFERWAETDEESDRQTTLSAAADVVAACKTATQAIYDTPCQKEG